MEIKSTYEKIMEAAGQEGASDLSYAEAHGNYYLFLPYGDNRLVCIIDKLSPEAENFETNQMVSAVALF